MEICPTMRYLSRLNAKKKKYNTISGGTDDALQDIRQQLPKKKYAAILSDSQQCAPRRLAVPGS